VRPIGEAFADQPRQDRAGPDFDERAHALRVERLDRLREAHGPRDLLGQQLPDRVRAACVGARLRVREDGARGRRHGDSTQEFREGLARGRHQR
jgi:hypothetical protein